MTKFINKNNRFFVRITGILIIIGYLISFLFSKYMGNYIFILGAIIGAIPVLIKTLESLKVKVISIDLLVSIAIFSGLIIGEYQESIIVSFLFMFGEFLEKKTLKKTRGSIRKLAKLSPKKANKRINHFNFKEVAVDDLNIGDIIIVKTGSQIPIDGVVIKGTANIDQSVITGESKLISVSEKTNVFAGSIIDSGNLEIKVTKIGEDTIFGKIIELVEEAQDNKSSTEKFIDKFAKYYTPTVLIIAILSFILTKDTKFAITILVLGCPGALVIGPPISMVAGIGNGANKGILFQGGDAVEKMSNVKTFIFDKTNTLTKGKMKVTSVKEFDILTDKEKKLIVSIEQQSNHPLSKAIIEYFNIKPEYITTKTYKGLGIGSGGMLIGNLKLMKNNSINISDIENEYLNYLQDLGVSIVLISNNNKIISIIGVSDTLKNDAKKAMLNLKKLGIKNEIILSGDNYFSVKNIAEQLNIDKYHGDLLPNEKQKYVNQIQKKQDVAFIGDGINDAPSIAAAEIGIAMGSGTDVAIETSDIVLANSKLSSLVETVSLSKKIENNVKENIVIAVLTVALLLIGLIFGIVNMISGIFFHELSILIVLFNSLRLTKYSLKN